MAAAHSNWSVPALWIFLVSYLLFGAVTWLVYLRKPPAEEGSENGDTRSLAYTSV